MLLFQAVHVKALLGSDIKKNKNIIVGCCFGSEVLSVILRGKRFAEESGLIIS